MSSCNHKLKRLQRRAEFLENLILKSVIFNKENDSGMMYERAELAALEWAIPILDQFIKNKNGAG